MKLILLVLREGRLAALSAAAALLALAAAAALAIAPAAADGHPSDIELVLSLADDSDNVVPPGSEFTVEAALRFTDQPPDTRRLSLAAGSSLRLYGYFDWEGPSPQRIDIPAEAMFIGGGPPLNAVDASGNNLGSNWELVARALDGRTLVARTSQLGHGVFIFDAWNKRQVGTIGAPDGAVAGSFGQSGAQRRAGKAIAVWHDDSSDTAWVFIGSNQDTVEGRSNTGKLYIYKLDWSVAPLGVTLAATLAPPSSEFTNSLVSDSNYGLGVVVSRDGSTLAVSASSMNAMGAVYVYPRPDGAGEDWGDLEYADGIKVTPAPAPSWGTASTRPFDHARLARCDAYCSRVTSLTGGDGGGSNRSNFGWWGLDLSADGSVLAVGAPNKRYPFSTLGSQFTGGEAGNGEAYIFLAPNGDWRTTPEVTGTLIPAEADASGFDPEIHYSPGPSRRVTEPDAVLLGRSWDTPIAQGLGREIEVSDDGSIVAVGAHSVTRVMIFQRDSAADWADAGDLLPSAQLITHGSGIVTGGMAMNGEGSVVLVGQREYTSYSDRIGRVLAYSRPAGGQWTGTVPLADARQIQAPSPRRNGDFAFPRYDLRGERLAMSESAEWLGTSGDIWLSDSGCIQSVEDGRSVWTCPITLSREAKVVVPFGSEDGSAAIAGSVTLSVDGVADSEIELSDTLQVTIGTVRELDELSLALATNRVGGAPYPSLIERGGKTRLQLQILNENGKPAGTGSLASVVVTTTLGGLTSLVENGECGGGQGRSHCIIPVSALTSKNSGNLLIELAHQGTAGTAQVWATALSKAGDRATSERVTVAVAGEAAALAIAEPSSPLLDYAPTDSLDRRNTVTLVVSATDEAGNRAVAPAATPKVKLTGPDDKAVSLTGANRKVSVEWPLRDAAGAAVLKDGNLQARITVRANRDAPLAVGEYTLELTTGVSVGTLTGTQTFNVAGGAAEIELSLAPSDEIEIGDPVRVTATLTDANGAPVPDGTPVNFSEGSGGAGALVLLGSSRQLTRGGTASTTLRGVNTGAAYVRADADGAADLRAITIVEPDAPQQQEQVSSTESGFVTWTGAGYTTAAALYASLEGATRLSAWTGSRWLSYSERNGRPIVGSVNFTILRGEVLWLSRE